MKKQSTKFKKVLFLDIDGVVNHHETHERHQGFIGIDRNIAPLVAKIIAETDCDVVLSSTWRVHKAGREEVSERVAPFQDITPILGKSRGEEIQAWLDKHPEVERYAILDDDPFMLDSQLPNVFKTSFYFGGLSEHLADKVIEHLV